MEHTGTVTVVDPSWPEVASSSTLFSWDRASTEPVAGDEVTAIVGGRPKTLIDLYAPASHTLVSDCEAMLAAYRRYQAKRPAWAIALGHASLPAPVAAPSLIDRAFDHVRRAGNWLARAARRGAELGREAVRAVCQSDIVRRVATRRCPQCRAASVRNSFELYVPFHPTTVAQAIGERRWDVLRERAVSGPYSTVSVRISRCHRCVDSRSADIVVTAIGEKELMGRDIELSNDELYYLLSIAPE